MGKALAIINGFEEIKGLVLNGIANENTRNAYENGLDSFLSWFYTEGKTVLNKTAVQEYRAMLDMEGQASATINLKLAAVRRLVVEAIDNGILDPIAGQGILRVKGIKARGVRTGNWLTKQQAQEIINAPDISTLKGLRDRAILAVALGSGLRRSEIANLKVDNIQMRDSRWVILDITGKGEKIRTVPIASWVKEAIDQWLSKANITDGFLFRSTQYKGKLIGKKISDQAIQDVIIKFTGLSAHDMRRSFAKLAYKGGAAIEQIKFSLGHQKMATTELYLGSMQDLLKAPTDFIGLTIN